MSHHHHINAFRAADDDGRIADVPDHRPCPAHGDAAAEAVAEAEIAIEPWLEVAAQCGPPVSEPRYRPAIHAAA